MTCKCASPTTTSRLFRGTYSQKWGISDTSSRRKWAINLHIQARAMGKQMWNKFASLTSRQPETAPGENIQRGVPTNVNNIGALNMIVCTALRAEHGRNSMFASVGAHLHMAASSCSALPSVNIIICHGEGIICCQGTHAEEMLRLWLLEHWLEHQLLEHWSSLQNPLLACSGSPGWPLYWPGPGAKLIFISHFPLHLKSFGFIRILMATYGSFWFLRAPQG